jgi:hypothetical protein
VFHGVAARIGDLGQISKHSSVEMTAPTTGNSRDYSAMVREPTISNGNDVMQLRAVVAVVLQVLAASSLRSQCITVDVV